jgi:hypothetical protein
MSEAAAASPAAGLPSAQAGRRRAVRYLCRVSGECRPAGNAHSTGVWPVELRNISHQGVALELSRRFEPGTGLLVELPEQDGQVGQILLARVVRVAPVGDSMAWTLGCTLVKPLADQDLRGLAPAARAA